MYTLRDYQHAAVNAIWLALRTGNMAPCVCLPTGAGKTAVVAELVRHAVSEWDARVLVLCHVRELLEQLADGISKHYGAGCPIGIYSAGMGKKDIAQITVAGIQSAFRNAEAFGAVNLVIIDEAHCVPPDGEGMYQTMLAKLRETNQKMRLVGLTATPYRMTTGIIFGSGGMFDSMVFDAGVRPLIDQGYLCPLRGKDGGSPNLAGVHRRGGEWIASELEDAMADEAKVSLAVAELLRHAGDRKAWLVFTCGCRHAEMVRAAIAALGITVAVITGDTPKDERDNNIAAYKQGKLRCLVNVNVLTTGFDAPHVDCVAMLRPTESPGLYYQMVGRGLRVHPDKQDCIILDMAGNIQRHGPVDRLNDRLLGEIREDAGQGGGAAPMKTCPECAEMVLCAIMTCPSCGHIWVAEVAKHDTTASNASPLHVDEPPIRHEIDRVEYREWAKRGNDGAPKTLRVDYYQGYHRIVSEWVCVEHSGYAGERAQIWLAERVQHGWQVGELDGHVAIHHPDRGTATLVESMAMVAEHALRSPCVVVTKRDGEYDRVIGYEWPAMREPGDDEEEVACAVTTYSDDDEPPF